MDSYPWIQDQCAGARTAKTPAINTGQQVVHTEFPILHLHHPHPPITPLSCSKQHELLWIFADLISMKPTRVASIIIGRAL